MSTLALHLVPQALPLSIPIGLTFGILCGLGRVSASYRSRAVILSLAAAASFVSFTMLAWVVPMANQAFRGAIAGQPLAKGSRELTLGELRMAPAMTLRLHHTSAFAAAWMPNITFLIVSLVLMKPTSKSGRLLEDGAQTRTRRLRQAL